MVWYVRIYVEAKENLIGVPTVKWVNVHCLDPESGREVGGKGGGVVVGVHIDFLWRNEALVVVAVHMSSSDQPISTLVLLYVYAELMMRW